MKVPTLTIWKTLGMRDATFTHPDLTTFWGLDELALVVTGQQLACGPVAPGHPH